MERKPGPAAGSAAKAGRDWVGTQDRSSDTTLTALRLAASRRMRRQRYVERLCQLGPRVVAELLDELDRHHQLGGDLDDRLERYAQLDATVLAALGADRFPALPLRCVGEER